ncbi:MAG: hypothetical protein AB1631_11115 [Acidobacteriota bacterium]
MSENLNIREPLFKLIVRFGNGETINHFVNDQINPDLIRPETRFAIISSVSVQNPSQCTDITVINMRDVTYIKTESVTVEQLTTEKRKAGIFATGGLSDEEKLPKTLAHVKFV